MNAESSQEAFQQKCPNCEILRMEKIKLAEILSEQKATYEEVRKLHILLKAWGNKGKLRAFWDIW